MVQAWYMDQDQTNPQAEHHQNPPKYITLDNLFKVSGVEYFKINVDTYKTDGMLEAIREERGYNYEDEITCSEECTPNLEDKLKIFFEEHLHTDEEIRLVIDGSGYFDVRDKNDLWIRIHVIPGDLLIIPSGIFHRFILDTKMFITAKRLFVGEPVWVPHNRAVAENMDCRLDYLKKIQAGFIRT